MLMLCSDGLNGMLGDDQIRDILLVNPDPTDAAKSWWWLRTPQWRG